MMCIPISERIINVELVAVPRPAVDKVGQRSIQHMKNWGLFKLLDVDEAKYNQHNIGIFVEYVYPTASEEILLLNCNEAFYLTLYDDYVEKIKPEDALKLETRLLEVLRKNEIVSPDSGENPFVIALSEIWAQYCKKTPSHWQKRMIKEFELWFEAEIIMRTMLQAEKPPSVHEFMTIRSREVAFDFMIFVGELATGFIPEELYNDSFVQVILERARCVTCLMNDVYSIEKDIKNGVYNYVTLLQNEKKISQSEAIKQTIDRIETHIDEIKFQGSKMLEARNHDPLFKSMLDAIKVNIRGCYDYYFHSATKRFV